MRARCKCKQQHAYTLERLPVGVDLGYGVLQSLLLQMEVPTPQCRERALLLAVLNELTTLLWSNGDFSYRVVRTVVAENHNDKRTNGTST